METAPLEASTGLHRLRQMTWWSTTGMVWGFAAIAVVWVAVIETGQPALRAAVIVAVLLTAGAAGWLLAEPLREGRSAGSARKAAVAAVAAVGAVVVALLVPSLGRVGAWSPLAPACAVAAIVPILPRRRRALLLIAGVIASGALAAVGSYLATGEVSRALVQTGVFLGVLLPATVLTQVWIWDVAERLDDARRLAGELAVADERLRFAADLHDIQGHHLQVIALKSELAARLAQADPPQAAAHMREVQQLARTAIEDTRAVVHGYRRVSLAGELANAAKVLAAAGIDCPAPDEDLPAQMPEPARHLLGLVVREATTNVLRHSHARRADVGISFDGDSAVLRVRNDGARGGRSEGGGTGLRALAGRLADAGGTLVWTCEDEEFLLTARVPVPQRVGA